MANFMEFFHKRKVKAEMTESQASFSSLVLWAFVKFLFLRGKSAKDIHTGMSQTLGEKCPSCSTVKTWISRFKTGYFTVEDEPRSGRPQNTFRPKKKFEPGSLRYSLHKHAQASLNSGINLREAVRVPPGESLNDWLAVHVVDFFNRINLIYGTVTDYCTEETCPTMSGGPKYEYLWADGAEYKKPTALSAPKYVSLLMDWVESQINNEDIFPVKVEVPFPKTFLPTCKKILTRLFRVFVHVYIHHFDRLLSIGAEAHVNMCYKHFYYFVTEFDLVSEKELEPLAEMSRKICKSPAQKH